MNEDRDALLSAAEVDDFLDVFVAAVEALLDDETLGPCGCTDYHMADCNVGGAWLVPEDRDVYIGDDGPDDDPRQWED